MDTDEPVNNMIKEALLKLRADIKQQDDVTFAGTIPLNGIGWLNYEVFFSQDSNGIGVRLCYNLMAHMDKVEEIRTTLEQLSKRACCFKDGKRWMKMTLSTEPIHLVIIGHIRVPSSGLTRSHVFFELCDILAITKANWPLSRDH